ncbi:hypothetical protein ACFPRL_13260 [Pseudoclavibacter helvolus]
MEKASLLPVAVRTRRSSISPMASLTISACHLAKVSRIRLTSIWVSRKGLGLPGKTVAGTFCQASTEGE